MAGLYIHIPFCVSRCIYCGFYSTTSISLQQKYTDVLCRELELRRNYLKEAEDAGKSPEISTIYLGGGTPSQLSPDNLNKIFDAIYNKVFTVSGVSVSPTSEVTIECNPDDITPQFVNTVAQLPINRVSMGVQTFSDQRLKFLQRRHTSQDVGKATDLLRKADIRNISIDLMFGFPQQSIEEWKSDLQSAIELGVEHISAYSLMYEENTPLYNLLQRDKIQEVDEETALSMYDTLIGMLTANGFEHYEISNFARLGFRSRHNSNYWQAVSYLGIGASAHSYNGYTRQWNVADINRYIQSIEQGILPAEIEKLDDDTRYNDLITTKLRTKEGINLSALHPTYQSFLLRYAQPHLLRNNLQLINNHLSLTRKGIFISDSIMTDLIKVDNS